MILDAEIVLFLIIYLNATIMPALVMATCAFHRWASDRLPPCCLSGTPRHCKGGVYGCSSWQNKNFQVGLLHLDVPWKGLVSTWVLPPCQCVVPGLIILFTWSPLATWVPVEDSGAKQRWSLKLDVSNFLEHRGLTHWHIMAFSAYGIKSHHGFHSSHRGLILPPIFG